MKLTIEIDPKFLPAITKNFLRANWVQKIVEYVETGDKAKLPDGVTVPSDQLSLQINDQ